MLSEGAVRKIPRSIYEEARDVARALAKTKAFEQSCRERKRIEMLFAHLKRILRLGRLRLRGPRGAQFEFTLAAIAQNLRRLAKLVARPPPAVAGMCCVKSLSVRVTNVSETPPSNGAGAQEDRFKKIAAGTALLTIADFCNKICHKARRHQLYSITSSARARSDGGTLRPSALAVLRLMTSSYLVGACTGRSAGFSPLRMRST